MERFYCLTQSDPTPSFLADLLGTKQTWILTILSAAILVCVLLVVFVIRQVCSDVVEQLATRINISRLTNN